MTDIDVDVPTMPRDSVPAHWARYHAEMANETLKAILNKSVNSDTLSAISAKAQAHATLAIYYQNLAHR